VAGPSAAAGDPAGDRAAQARRAQASGQLIDVASEAAIADCHDLGSETSSTTLEGLAGRAHVRVELRRIGRARGASHVLYADYRGGETQRERGRFFDCSGDFVAGPPAATAPGAPPVAPVAPEPRPVGTLGLQVEALPAGTLVFPANPEDQHIDAATATGLTGAIEWFASEGIALGLAPRVIFGLKPDRVVGDSTTELDVRGRLRFGQLDRDGLMFSGNITIGGSFLFLPADLGTASGALFGVGVGVTYPVKGRGFFNFEIGYQLSDQGLKVNDVDVGFSTQLLHIGVGFGSYL
jgi:hypothetical protein